MIKIEGLVFCYDGAPWRALSDISLEINEGDFVGIIGPSGAGKSTLTYVLNGIVPHHYSGDFGGRVEIYGMDTVKAGPETLSKCVGSVFQDVEGQILSSVVEDEILFGLENFGVPRDEIERRMEYALETAGISDLRHRNIIGLSGGQKQKVAIASIIALRPKIMVLDEPTGELDPRSSRMVFETLKELNERHGITIVVVEQKIMMLCEFAGRLVVMNEGRIAVEGFTREVLRRSDVLEDVGVNIPRVTTLAGKLRGLGLYGGTIPLNLAEAEKMMRETAGNAEI
jgi:energy-coupling factor transport system ATP-binding protein